jgi:glutamine synthetase
LKIADFLSFVLLRDRMMKSAISRMPSGASRAFAAKRFFGEEGFGKHLFTGVNAAPYLAKQGLSASILDNADWTRDMETVDAVARAVMDWGRENGANVYTHWFQPLGAAGVREGCTGQVHNKMFDFTADGTVRWQFEGKTMLKGETDGSSFPNGGLRATHTAGGYNILDPSSPIFMRGDTIYLPCIFVTWHGHSVDEKTPLLRSVQAMSKEGKRLMKNLGWDVPGLQANIGLEQEFFLVPRDKFLTRTDLQMTGRTVMGRQAPRGQEMCDHYMGPPYETALKCMQEIQDECYKMGIPLKTRHREVAPNQYEFAPYFGFVTTQIDQNLIVMQIATEVAAKHDLACLLQEKPFSGINGSGKHNNWSLFTTDGVGLLNPKAVTKASGNPEVFPIVMAALVRAIDMHGDMMRASIASPGNDFRLGACEAPPAIISTYLGEAVTKYLEEFKSGKVSEYAAQTKKLDCGVESIAPFDVPAEDRNRTSPFPYGGHRFEFRAVGSSQNVSMVNTVLCAIAAESFKAFSDAIEAGAKPAQVAADALNKHWKCIFNGNGYAEEWPQEAVNKGVWRIDSGVESIARITDPKNIKLMEDLKILTKEECEARAEIMFDFYSGTVEMEALCMIDMIVTQIIPAVKQAGVGSVSDLQGAADAVKAKLDSMHSAPSAYEKATIARELRLETMESARGVCDSTEAIMPANLWPMATYKDLLFLDYTQ